jgi:glycine cleavage system H protein
MAFKTPPENLYQKSDEYVKLDGDVAYIGISDYAQDALNDIVFVELPSVGDTFKAGETFGVVESVKAASDLISPIEGEVIEVNAKLEQSPELLNADPYTNWIIKLKVIDSSASSDLMNADAYAAYCEGR